MGDSINPFAVLGVDETATAEEITAAYRAQKKRRAVAARRGEQLPRHPSWDAVEQPAPAAPQVAGLPSAGVTIPVAA